jgi:hypothetical protein
MNDKQVKEFQELGEQIITLKEQRRQLLMAAQLESQRLEIDKAISRYKKGDINGDAFIQLIGMIPIIN